MVELEDSVLIRVAPERVWSWLNDLPRHYRDWHPDHVSCRYEHGEDLKTGSVLVLEEYLHGRLHRLRLRATQVTPGSAIRYRGRGVRGAFLVSPAGTGSRFTATLSFGTRIPLVRGVSDAVVRLLMGRRLAALQEHMREEGQDLKALLERQSNV
jgi:hypothetical protein